MGQRDIYAAGFDDDHPVSTDSACPECAGPLRTERGEVGCVECGLVVSVYRLDHGARSRTFDDAEGDRERTGAPLTPTLHDRGLTTEIGKLRDGQGSVIPTTKRRELARLRTHHSRARWRSKAEQNLAHGLGEIARIASALELPGTVRDRACELFREAQRRDLLYGRSVEELAAASVHGACRCLGQTRRLSEVVAVARGSESGIENGYRVLNRELGLRTGIVRPVDFVPRFAAELGLPDGVRRRARELAELAEETGLGNGRRPSGVAGAACYLAARERGWPLTQTAVVEVADVSAVTIRNRFRELTDERDRRDREPTG